MPRRTAIKPIVSARKKTQTVRNEIRQAASELHETNEALLESSSGPATQADVQEAVDRSVKVEGQLHEAAKELEVVTGLLHAAEAAAADPAGQRSGEGTESVIRHMQGSGQAGNGTN
jgi:hypothetical protein